MHFLRRSRHTPVAVRSTNTPRSFDLKVDLGYALDANDRDHFTANVRTADLEQDIAIS